MKRRQLKATTTSPSMSALVFRLPLGKLQPHVLLQLAVELLARAVVAVEQDVPSDGRRQVRPPAVHLHLGDEEPLRGTHEGGPPDRLDGHEALVPVQPRRSSVGADAPVQHLARARARRTFEEVDAVEELHGILPPRRRSSIWQP